MKNICKVPECEKYCYGNGYCQKHNRNNKLYGDPLKTQLHLIGRKFHKYKYIEDNKTIEVYTMKGESFFIDSDDIEIIKNITFNTDDRNYLYGGNRKIKTKQLHRLIMGEPEGKEIDHIDGNPLNNRKSNLRICTHKDNMKNINIRTTSKSGVRGVCWCDVKKKWRAYITSNYKTIHIGYYDNINEAKKARLEKQNELHKEFSRK